MSGRAGVALKRWRESEGLTQSGVAELVKVDQPTVAHWEAGRREPSVDEALRLDEVSAGVVSVRVWRHPESRRKAS